MPLFDRYLLRRFFRTLVVCFLSAAGLFVVIDAFNNIEEFISLGESQGGIATVLIGYYGPRVAWVFDRLGPFLTLLSAMFTIAWLYRSNEMTALFAGGIPPRRIARPLIGATFAVAVLGIANREILLPNFRDQLSRNAQDWLGKRGRPVYARYDNRTGILLNGQYYYAGEKRISLPKFTFEEPVGDYGRHLAAENAYYHYPTKDRPGGYLLENVTEPAHIAELPPLTIAGKLTVLTPQSTPWLSENQCFVASDVGFEQLAGGAGWRQFASTWQLWSGLRNPSLDFGADVQVEIHSRLVRPFLDLVLLFLGLPLAFSAEQRNVFLAAGKGVLLALGFMVVVLACQGMGAGLWMRPSLAAWAPLLVFVPLAVYLNDPLKK